MPGADQRTTDVDGGLFAAVFRDSPLPMAITRMADGTYLDVNESFLQLAERTREEVLGASSLDLDWVDASARDRLVADLRAAGKASATAQFHDGRGELRRGWFSCQTVEFDGEPAILTMIHDLTAVDRIQEELHESEAHLRMLVDNMPGIMWTTDDRLVIESIQGAALRGMPFTNEGLIGLPLTEMLGPAAEDFADELAAPVKGLPSFLEARVADHILAIYLQPITHEDGRTGVMGAAIDVTKIRQTEAAVRNTADRLQAMRDLYRAILSARSPEVIAQYACERLRELIPCDRSSVSAFDVTHDVGRLVAVSTELPTTLLPGYTYHSDAFVSLERFVEEGMVSEDLSTEVGLREPRKSLLEEGMRSYVALPLLVDGELIGTLAFGSRQPGGFADEHLDTGREVANSLAVAFQQARLRERAEDYAAELEVRLAQLHQTDAERRHLLAQVVRGQEEERRRIANDIHDDSIQKMAAVGLRLDVIRHIVDEPEVLDQIDQLAEVVSLSIGRLRRLMFDLWPPDLERYGLGAAIRADLIAQRDDHGIDFSLQDDLDVTPALEERIIAYRIVQEALSNVRRHSGASMVEVKLASQDGGMKVRVHDDGQGFPPGTDSSPPGHLGLSTMRERAELAGGWLEAGNDPDGGARISFFLPAGSRGATDAGR